MTVTTTTGTDKSSRSTEWRLFLLLTVFLAPLLAVALVSALGFSIWIYQIFAGPPGI